jgi:hypothetical protein
MKKRTDSVEREKKHPTVSDSPDAGESEPILSVRAGDVWTDFVRDTRNEGEAEPPRQSGTVPLLDDMTGIRQWE